MSADVRQCVWIDAISEKMRDMPHEDSPRRGRQITDVGGASAEGASGTHGKRPSHSEPGEGRDHRRRRRSERRGRERSPRRRWHRPCSGLAAGKDGEHPSLKESRGNGVAVDCRGLAALAGLSLPAPEAPVGLPPSLRHRRRQWHPSLGGGKRSVLPGVPFAPSALTPPPAVFRRPLRGLSSRGMPHISTVAVLCQISEDALLTEMADLPTLMGNSAFNKASPRGQFMAPGGGASAAAARAAPRL